MLDLISKPPTKIMFTAPGCSPAAEPIAEAASFWGAVQVMRETILINRYVCGRGHGISLRHHCPMTDRPIN